MDRNPTLLRLDLRLVWKPRQGVPCCGRQIAQGFKPVSGRERRTEVRWEFGRYLLNLSDAQPASLVKLTLWVEPRTITVMVPEIPYS